MLGDVGADRPSQEVLPFLSRRCDLAPRERREAHTVGVCIETQRFRRGCSLSHTCDHSRAAYVIRDGVKRPEGSPSSVSLRTHIDMYGGCIQGAYRGRQIAFDDN